MSDEDTPPPVSPPPVIRIEELLASQDALRQKEQDDRIHLNTLSYPNVPLLRDALYKWVAEGFPESYSVLSIPLVCPAVCSDGVKRSLSEYILHVTGKTIQQLLSEFQTFLDGIQVDYRYQSERLSLLVSRTR